MSVQIPRGPRLANGREQRPRGGGRRRTGMAQADARYIERLSPLGGIMESNHRTARRFKNATQFAHRRLPFGCLDQLAERIERDDDKSELLRPKWQARQITAHSPDRPCGAAKAKRRAAATSRVRDPTQQSDECARRAERSSPGRCQRSVRGFALSPGRPSETKTHSLGCPSRTSRRESAIVV